MTAEINASTHLRRTAAWEDILVQAIKYAAVGVSNTVIDAAVYFALTRWVSWFASALVLAKGIAYAVGMLNSFYWNRNWTFQSQGQVGLAAAKFTLTHIAALAINAGVMAVSLNSLHLPETAGLVLATAAAFGWNFALNKWVVFRD